MKLAQRLAEAHNLAQPILHRDLTARIDVSMKDWLRRTVQAVQGPGLQSSPDVELLGQIGSWLLEFLGQWLLRKLQHKVELAFIKFIKYYNHIVLKKWLLHLMNLTNWLASKLDQKGVYTCACEIHKIEKRLGEYRKAD